MGHSIVYCDKCGQLLKEEDFRQGRASIVDNRSFCAACLPVPLGEPASVLPAKKASSTQIPKPAGSGTVSSTRIPKQPAPASVTSTRVPKAPTNESRRVPMAAPPPAAPAPNRVNSQMLLVGGGIVLAALVGVVVLAFGGNSRSHLPDGGSAMPAVVPVKPVPAESISPEMRRIEEAARAACARAYDIQHARPNDRSAQWKAFQTALVASRGTSYAGEAEDQLKKLRKLFDAERSELEARTQEDLAHDQLKTALDRWEAELKRSDVPEWRQEIAQRVADLKSELDRRLGDLRDAAVEAKRRGDVPEMQKIRARVNGWGIEGYGDQVDRALAEIAPPSVERPPDSARTAPALESYRARWKALLAGASVRDAAQAAQALEKLLGEAQDARAKKEAGEDLENLKLAASVFQESYPLLKGLPRGQKTSLVYWDPAGTLCRIDEIVEKTDAQRLETRSPEGPRVIPFGEIAPVTLAELFRSRPSRKDTDARAALVACLLDGDPDDAQQLRTGVLPAVSDKYFEVSRNLVERRGSEEREKAARALFYQAESRFFDYVGMPGAVARYRSLLSDYGSTEFVLRNRPAIAARTEGPKDFMFMSGDFTCAPTFKLTKVGKAELAWVSQQDLDLGRLRENYVEFEFGGAPETAYQCWVLAGGCCQEVLTFYCQATELTSPDSANPKERIPLEPGGNSGILVRPTHSSLKKLHSQHLGPKNPQQFEWIHVGVLKFPTAGRKTVRILSNQKGFAVECVAVLSTRKGPPREVELRDFERWRAETPGASARQGGATGSILREVWKNIQGGNVSDLTQQQAFKEDRPDERGLLTEFEGPTNIDDNYGTRIRGYLYPPVSGAYIFWIASDDQGELYLSTDEDPAHKRRIAMVPVWTNPREWTKFPEQQSQPIELKDDCRYYIEALHKEGIGGDHVSVGWQLPSGVQERPIPGKRLAPVALLKK